MSEYLKMKQVPIIETVFDIQDLVNNPVGVFEKYRKKYGSTFSFRFGVNKTIVTGDPEVLKHVLKDNNANYHKSHIQVKRFVEFQGIGLTNSHGDYWFRQRRLLSMGFSPSHLKKLLPLQLQVLKDFMTNFDTAAKKGPVEIHQQMVHFTLRAVGKSLFGSELKEVELEKFAHAIEDIQAFITKQVVKPFLIPWYKISGESKKYQDLRKEGDKIIIDYVNQRRKSGIDDGDILKIMLNNPYKDTGEYMSDERVMVEILQLLVAGNETSTTAATWTFYTLAQYPEHVLKMRKEINSVFGDEHVDYGKLRQLEFTLQVINESMRLNPPFWMIDREAQGDDEINGIKIPKGTTVIPYILGAHHNEEYWPDPKKFDPSRFDFTKNKKNHPFAHIPFGGGPRVCIGQNMAQMQMLLVVSAIVRNYDFKLTEDKPIGWKAMMLLRPDGPMYMDFIPVDS
jgi:cytochrome P450